MVLAGMRGQRGGAHPSRVVVSMVLLLIPALLMIAGAVSLWLQCGGGLYWITAAVAMGFASATANAWVLLVEIKR
jgi:sterol desaturase/sphingolipid hydroxylase (fatty acid hydroxylase superfamily)